MHHPLSLKQQYLHGSFSNSYKPILTVESGDSITLKTLDIEWGYSTSKNEEYRIYSSREQEEKPQHPMIGPIAIKGAKPGMVLEGKSNDIVPGWYGRNWAGGMANWQNNAISIANTDRIQLDWELDSEKMIGSTSIHSKLFHVALQQFMGVLGVAPKEAGVHSTSPPRYCGGNIDCKEIVKGSSLFLPISFEDTLFSIGDGHALQGDGEISSTAIECPMDHVDITLVVREDLQLTYPRAKTPTGWITFGFDDDLDKATEIALADMLSLMTQLYSISRTEATALASVTVDLRITQIVNGVKGVHAILNDGVIR
ncbi:acetamidase/formamidase family protein [Niallia alba]|uniref:acetamidase/formamidase family protein n=1 Tax=Niallia alba TaxID=2729105 RepID=UPI0039A29F0F